MARLQHLCERVLTIWRVIIFNSVHEVTSDSALSDSDTDFRNVTKCKSARIITTIVLFVSYNSALICFFETGSKIKRRPRRQNAKKLVAF
ncbi:unnamed protein product [Leptidea sinapis]|uniref:Uncharacterized protein n=1 Tax=Leptidea sinapis TaxID=189913 RepID=A0A5E4Q9T1_9NEOP|nr:unnamed protein product [Leptidea sinapis]